MVGREEGGERVGKKGEKTGTKKTDQSLSRHEPESDDLIICLCKHINK